MRLEDVQIGQRVRVAARGCWLDAAEGQVVGIDVDLVIVGSQYGNVWTPPGLLEPVAPVIDWQARAERAEADAALLYAALDELQQACHLHRHHTDLMGQVHTAMLAYGQPHDEAAAQR